MKIYFSSISLPCIPDEVVKSLLEIPLVNHESTANRYNVMTKLMQMFSTLDVEEINFPIILTEHDVTVTITREIYDMLHKKCMDTYRKTSTVYPSRYYRINLSEHMRNSILECLSLPEKLISLEPRIALQVSVGGLIPHVDFNRKSSLFYLLTDNHHLFTTTWYKHKNKNVNLLDPNELGFRWVAPDPDDLILAAEQQLKYGVWYIFNNHEYHSVFTTSNDKRVSISVEFDITAQELFEILNENGQFK